MPFTEETGTPSYYSAVNDSAKTAPARNLCSCQGETDWVGEFEELGYKKRDVVVAAIRDRGDPVRFPVDAAGRRVPLSEMGVCPTLKA